MLVKQSKGRYNNQFYSKKQINNLYDHSFTCGLSIFVFFHASTWLTNASGRIQYKDRYKVKILGLKMYKWGKCELSEGWGVCFPNWGREKAVCQDL